jgi:gluconokinase
MRPAAVAVCTFWHSFHGIDAAGKPTTRIIHLFDTRSKRQAARLKELTSEADNHKRTGCVFHTSYWPAKLLWLRETCSEAFVRTARWISFGEYLFLRLLGHAASSTSMVSASGIWNQNANHYEKGLLELLEVGTEQLAPEASLDEAPTSLRARYRTTFPLFDGIPWYPALGDGACNNVGSGCTTPDHFALMVGTSGALRAVVERPSIEIDMGVWCYRVDRRRFVVGGALSNGGFVYDKMRHLLRLPHAQKLESQLEAMAPGSHHLTALPFFNGERSTRWNSDARAAFTGLAQATSPVEMLRAAMESVALRFRLVYKKVAAVIGEPQDVIGSGSALTKSPAWTHMIADALGRPVTLCGESEASSRGAALVALERLGRIAPGQHPAARTGTRFDSMPQHITVYDELLERQEKLYRKLFLE